MGDESSAWRTAITEVKPNELRLRGYRLDELMGQVSFAEAAWLAVTGELPAPPIQPLVEALLACSVDHGVTPPSAQAARLVASTGGNLSQAVAAGVLSINASHGGAIEGCMLALQRGVELQRQHDSTPVQAAKALLDEFKAAGKRMPGYGHRLHTADPRTARLRELARAAGVYGKFMELADAVEEQFNAQGKQLPLNVDGAMGAVLCELDVPPQVANGFFVLPRVAGLIAHYAEERSREKVMRRIDPAQAVYDGAPPRELPRRS